MCEFQFAGAYYTPGFTSQFGTDAADCGTKCDSLRETSGCWGFFVTTGCATYATDSSDQPTYPSQSATGLYVYHPDCDTSGFVPVEPIPRGGNYDKPLQLIKEGSEYILYYLEMTGGFGELWRFDQSLTDPRKI